MLVIPRIFRSITEAPPIALLTWENLENTGKEVGHVFLSSFRYLLLLLLVVCPRAVFRSDLLSQSNVRKPLRGYPSQAVLFTPFFQIPRARNNIHIHQQMPQNSCCFALRSAGPFRYLFEFHSFVRVVECDDDCSAGCAPSYYCGFGTASLSCLR